MARLRQTTADPPEIKSVLDFLFIFLSFVVSIKKGHMLRYAFFSVSDKSVKENGF